MIIRPKLNWFRMLFVWRGSVLPQLLPRLALIFILSVAAIVMHDHVRNYPVGLGTPPFALVGIALAVFLGFRNSASYERWWEGRKLWGSLLIHGRSIARQALTLPRGVKTEDTREFIAGIGALGHALRHEMRRTDPLPDLATRLPSTLYQHVAQAQYRSSLILR